MGYLQNARQRLGSVARTVGRHAARVGKAALTAAAVAGAAYGAYQTHEHHLYREARSAESGLQAERGRLHYEELLRTAPHRQRTSPPAGSELWRGRLS